MRSLRFRCVAVMTRTSTWIGVVRPEGLEDAVLEHAEELHLRGDGHLRDLVEEERAAVRGLESAVALLGGAGERALLVAEELGLEEGLGERGAVDGDERLLRRAGSARGGCGRRAPFPSRSRP